MKQGILICSLLCFSFCLSGQVQSAKSTTSFPAPAFVLHDASRPVEKPHVELGPMHTDKNGKTTGSFAVYGGSLLIQLSSLSFSGDGKLLAAGSTPNIIDVWDVEKQNKIRSFEGGTAVALSQDGKLLATDGNGVEIWELASGKLKRRIPWKGDTIWRLTFDPSSTRILVRANGENDVVFDCNTGQKLATLVNTQEAQFSTDGSILVGGNAKHLIEWSTKDWSPVHDLPNGPEYVTRFAVNPDGQLVVIGGPKSARLVQLSSGQEVAKVGDGYTNFAAFSKDGTLIFTYTSTGFGIWNLTGAQICHTDDMGNGTMALSPDGRWLAAGVVGGMTNVKVWRVEDILKSCGIQRH